MANVDMLYEFLSNRIPPELSCDWDNDGRMCVPDRNRDVRRVLVCLDASSDAVSYAIEKNFDCIVTHHPMIFNPLNQIDGANGCHSKIIKLINAGISVLSFHTRLDKVDGGVNDVLAQALGLSNIEAFSDVGRMGDVCPISVRDFALRVANETCSDRTYYVDSGKKVRKAAIVGGSGKGYFEEAVKCGCDTFLTGEVAHNFEHEAKEWGINLVCCGHYYSENIICKRLCELVLEFDKGIYTEIFDTNPAICVKKSGV